MAFQISGRKMNHLINGTGVTGWLTGKINKFKPLTHILYQNKFQKDQRFKHKNKSIKV